MIRNPSVLMPVGMALETVRRVLFQPFDFVKWLAIGFTAWLAMLEGGMNVDFRLGYWKKKHVFQYGQVAWDWMLAHMFFVISLGILLVIVSFVVWFVIAWLSSRGKFMFLDNVVGNRAEIVQPWHKFRVQGNSCFWFLICFGLAAAVVFILGAGLVALVGWPDFSHSCFGWHSLLATWIGLIFLLCFIITAATIHAFFEDFVVPIMAMRSCRIMEGWKVFFELFRENVSIFILYLLFRLLFGLVIGLMATFLCCLLCCTLLIPYVGTVIILPAYVFWRAYSVHFIGQFGKNLEMFEGGGTSYISLSRA